MLKYRRAYQIGRDRRPTTRRKVCLTAKFQCRGSFEWIDCEVVNISPFGAELRVKEPMIVSRAVRLQILGDLFDATGDVRHQNGHTFGIEFTSSRLEAMARYS
ncbi:MAG: PilZ domain-containing protein [Pseudomonadota bacterium]